MSSLNFLPLFFMFLPFLGHTFSIDRVNFCSRFVDARASTRVAGWEEIAIDASSLPSEGSSVGERIKQGDSVVMFPAIISSQECSYLTETCSRIANQTTPTELEKRGLVRLPTISAAKRAAVTKTPCAEPLPDDVDYLLNEILSRVAKAIDTELPSVVNVLFDSEKLSNELDRLHFSSREPAINVYTSGGEFLAHKDSQALTVLIPLSSPEQFTGGGTAFWSQDSRGHRVEEPSIVLKPERGTAMLFGGCVTHAGVPVVTGTRIVFVASFSAKGRVVMQPEQRDVYGDIV